MPEEKTSVNVFDKEFWIKDKDGPQLKPEEIDDVKAKFKAAREARKAAKAASAVEGAVGGAGEGAVEVVASGKDSE